MKQPSLYIDAEPGVRTMITIEYVAEIETAWGVNADGETYGAAGKTGAGEPDLVAVTGTSPSGEMLDGYARASALDGPMPTSPADALVNHASPRAHEPVPAFESDGKTQIGTLR